MSSGRMAITVCTVVITGVIPGSGARVAAQEATLFPKQNAPYSELFKVPAPTTVGKAPQGVAVEAQPHVDARVRESTPRMVCGMKVIEGDPDVDSRIVIPIPERHNAKIRVLGPPPCERAAVSTLEGRIFGSVFIDPSRR